jgi:hypothetical protein
MAANFAQDLKHCPLEVVLVCVDAEVPKGDNVEGMITMEGVVNSERSKVRRSFNHPVSKSMRASYLWMIMVCFRTELPLRCLISDTI